MTDSRPPRRHWTEAEDALAIEAVAEWGSLSPDKRTAAQRAFVRATGRTVSSVHIRVRRLQKGAAGADRSARQAPWPEDLVTKLARMTLRGISAEECAHRLGRGLVPTQTKIEELRAAGALPPASAIKPRRRQRLPSSFATAIEAVRFINQSGHYTVTPCRGRWSIDGGPAVDTRQVIDLALFEVAALQAGA